MFWGKIRASGLTHYHLPDPCKLSFPTAKFRIIQPRHEEFHRDVITAKPSHHSYRILADHTNSTQQRLSAVPALKFTPIDALQSTANVSILRAYGGDARE